MTNPPIGIEAYSSGWKPFFMHQFDISFVSTDWMTIRGIPFLLQKFLSQPNMAVMHPALLWEKQTRDTVTWKSPNVSKRNSVSSLGERSQIPDGSMKASTHTWSFSFIMATNSMVSLLLNFTDLIELSLRIPLALAMGRSSVPPLVLCNQITLAAFQ